ncbi:MAG: SH3 domain-containing protein [Clostridiaceae bacterium]
MLLISSVAFLVGPYAFDAVYASEVPVETIVETASETILEPTIERSADEIYTLAQSQENPYDALTTYREGINLYSVDGRFQTGIDKSARTILSWSIGSHSKGQFDAAKRGYNTIISLPEVNVEIMEDAKRYLSYAIAGRIITTADTMVQQAWSTSNPYIALEIYKEGKYLYPRDGRFQTGIDKSAGIILNWSIGSHSRGQFDAAKRGYNTILGTSDANTEILEDTKRFLVYAEEKRIITTAESMVQQAWSTSNPYIALEIYKTGKYLYPRDGRFQTGIDKSARTILSWSIGSHAKGHFDAAISGYKTIIGCMVSDLQLKSEAQVYLDLAERKIVYNSEFTYLTRTNYASTLNAAVDIQLNKLSGSAEKSEIQYYMDPNNFLSKYQSENLIRVLASSLNVRSGPSVDYSKITQATYGNVYEYIEIKDNWYQIKLGSTTGWVSGAYMELWKEENPSMPVEFYQFLTLSGSSAVPVTELGNLLANKGILSGKEECFKKASIDYNINEIYLVSHALLETGNGTSALATGILVSEVKGMPVEPKVTYNMFGIGAYDGDAARLGSEYAYEQGWFTPEIAIDRGIKWISERYINNALYRQDTLYKMRWNPQNLGIHQYATDIAWAVKQTKRISDLYAQSKNYILRFDIPNYLAE